MQNTPAVRFFDRATPPHIVTLILITGISALSLNVFLPSLPGMTEYFGTDYRLIQLSVPVYLWVNAVLQIVVGPISDRIGRRPVVLAGFAIFVLASVGCALAPTVEIFLTFRMLQAAVVVGMVLSRAMVRDLYPQNQAASVMGYVTMGMALVPMVGPVIGGYLDELFGWQSNFWLLAGLGLIVLAICWSDLGETTTTRPTSFAAQFRQYPELFASLRFWGYCLVVAFSAGAFFAYLGGAPFIGSEVYGLSPSRLGLYFGAPAVGYFFGNYLSGRYAARIGINRMILLGSVTVSVGMVLLLAILHLGFGSAELFFAFMTFVGLGNGLVLPSGNAGLLSVRPHLAGSASGLGGAIMIGGGAALSALAGALLRPETGAIPLVWIQTVTALLALGAIVFVIRRERMLQDA